MWYIGEHIGSMQSSDPYSQLGIAMFLSELITGFRV